MSNAICVQDQCQTFLMYNRTANGLPYPSDNVVFVPYIKKICETGEGYVVSNYNLDGTAYTETIEEEIIPSDIDYQAVPICVEGQQALRWYVSSKGKPMGAPYVFHTRLDGTLFVIADHAEFTFGECGSADQCETHPIYSFSASMKYVEVLFQKRCPSPSSPNGYEITYTDILGNAKNPGTFLGPLVLPEELAVHQQVMCNGTTTFIRWQTTNKGVPVFFFDTDLQGTVIDDVTDPVRVGSCGANDQCQTERFYQLDGTELTPFLRKVCPGEEPVYYDVDGNEVDVATITGEVLFPEDVDVEQQVMCDGTSSFIRWFVAVKGQPAFSYDTDLEGAAFTPAGDVTAGVCGADETCETLVYYAVDGSMITPYRVKLCPGKEPVYFDEGNAEVPGDEIPGTIVPAGDLNVEQQVMCDGRSSFIRWFVAVKGQPAFNYDTDLDGATFTPAGDVTVGLCSTVAETCDTVFYLSFNGTTVRPFRIEYCPGAEPVIYDETHTVIELDDIEGTIVPAGDVDFEQQVMCDGETTFIRWFVAVNGGTAFFYDTDLASAPFTPAGDVSVGSCGGGGEGCDSGRFYYLDGSELTPILKKQCPGVEPVYYDVDGNEVDGATLTGEALFPEDVDVEQQVMCDGTSSFIRWFVAVKGQPAFKYDTDLEGAAFTPAGDVSVGSCGGGSEGCESARFYYLDGSELTPILKKQCAGEEPTYYDADGNEVDGATLTGEALFPEDVDVEQQVMCNGTSSFIRWFVAVKGQPAFNYDTDLEGTAFTPAGDVSVGSCGGGAEGCQTGRFYHLDGNGLAAIVKKECPGEEPLYYDVDGNEVDGATITGEIVFPEDVDVEQQVMCDGETTFIRWFVHVKTNSDLNFNYDTGLDGVGFTAAGDVRPGECSPCACCKTHRLYDLHEETLTSFFKEVCPGQDDKYYDLDGNEISYAELPGKKLFPEEVHFEQQLMCDGTRTFIRWHTAIKGEPSGIYRDTALDGSPLEPPPVAEDVRAGICPDCTRTEYRELCDYDVREPEVIAPPDRIFEGQELTGTFADGNDWLIPQISSKGVAGTYTYYSDRAVDLSFGVAVDVEITLFHREFWDNMATISPPVRVIAGAGSYDSITGILTAPPNTRTTILMENITSGRITPVEGEWLFESISIYSPARRQPILFREKTVIDCEGRVTVTYIDGNADEYTVLGEIRQCP